VEVDGNETAVTEGDQSSQGAFRVYATFGDRFADYKMVKTAQGGELRRLSNFQEARTRIVAQKDLEYILLRLSQLPKMKTKERCDRSYIQVDDFNETPSTSNRTCILPKTDSTDAYDRFIGLLDLALERQSKSHP